MCYTAKLGKYGLASLGLIGPGAVDIPADRVSVSDLPPVEEVIVSEPLPEVRTDTIVVSAVPTPTPQVSVAAGRVVAPERLPVANRQWIGDQRRCRPGFCSGD